MLFFRVLTAGALLAASMQADVTLRYKTEFEMNPSLPAQMTEQATKSMGAALPAESVMQVKAGKGASAFGKFRSIVDFANGRTLLMDPEQKRVTTVTSEEMAEEMRKTFADMPAEARAAMAAMKSTVDTKVTGRTSTIQGIAAEEREVTMTIDGPAAPNMPAGPMIKMTIQFWTATAAETARVPALRELAEQNIWSYATLNPTSSMEKLFQQIPGTGEGFAKFLKERQDTKAMLLRSDLKMWMPAVAALMKQMPPEKSPFGAAFDADAPFMEMTQSLSELSTAAIPASLFAVPEGYKEVPAGELVREMMKGQGAK
jgi:hypothetical protein